MSEEGGAPASSSSSSTFGVVTERRLQAELATIDARIDERIRAYNDSAGLATMAYVHNQAPSLDGYVTTTQLEQRLQAIAPPAATCPAVAEPSLDGYVTMTQLEQRLQAAAAPSTATEVAGIATPGADIAAFLTLAAKANACQKRSDLPWCEPWMQHEHDIPPEAMAILTAKTQEVEAIRAPVFDALCASYTVDECLESRCKVVPDPAAGASVAGEAAAQKCVFDPTKVHLSIDL